MKDDDGGWKVQPENELLTLYKVKIKLAVWLIYASYDECDVAEPLQVCNLSSK